MFSICQPDDAAVATEVLTDAFGADPLMWFLFADPERHDGQVARMMALTAERGTASGHGYCWRDDDDVTGVALWAPPGRPFYSDADRLRLGDIIVSADPNRAELISGGLAELGQHRPDEPFFYLQMLGVRSSARGQGIGADLLGRTLELVDRLGVAAHLESSNQRNVSLYERHGFEVVAELTMPEGGPTVRPMFRPAGSRNRTA